MLLTKRAEMLCAPNVSVLMLNVATPPLKTVAVPIWVEPFHKVTDPAGMPVPGAVGVTVTVKTTI